MPLGSNRPWSFALLVLWVFGLIGLWLQGAARGRWSAGAALRRAYPVLILFGVWLVLGLLQLVPLPQSVLGALSPQAAALYAGAGVPGAAPLTLDLHVSLWLWFGSLAYAGVFVLVLVLVRDRERLRMLIHALVLAALAQAMFASLAALAHVDLGVFGSDPAAHGTFPNRNHLAGYLELSLALGIGLLMADIDGDRRPTWRQRLRNWAHTLLGRKARLRIYLAVMVVTLVLTGSRMGNTAFFSALLLTCVIALLFYRSLPRAVLVLLVSLVLVDLLILGSWFGLDRVRERLERTVLTTEDRYHLDVQGLGYLEDLWLTGSGGGSFATVFPAYRDPGLSPGFYNHAHNDYLEFLLEFGVLGVVPLAGLVLASLVAAVAVLRKRRDPLLRGAAFAALLGVTALLIHSSADFNLRIPANAMLFVVVLALPWLGLGLGRGQRSDQGIPPSGRSPQAAPRRFEGQGIDSEQAEKAAEHPAVGDPQALRGEPHGSESRCGEQNQG